MNKNHETILEKLREAMIKEELAIPLYVSHIEQTLFWSGLPMKKQKIVIDNLKILEADSEMHARAFETLLKKYTKLK